MIKDTKFPAKIKICGLKSAENISSVAALLPDYMGFIFYEKSPRRISEISAELIQYIPAEIRSTGVFVNETIEEVKERIRRHQLKAVQLHGNESPVYADEIRQTGVEVIKAFGIEDTFDFSKLKAYEAAVDYFLFDTRTAGYGGSGKTFNWQLLQGYEGTIPYFLSGGIDLQHLELLNAWEDSRLYAIDINSRFERSPGIKDIEKIKQFLNLK